MSEKTMNDRIDELEVALLNSGKLVDCPLKHVFTTGLYSRTIAMPATATITSLYHKETHQYIVSCGTALVKIGENEWERISAPHIGITKAGTRRVLYIEEECIWTTVHATNIVPKDESPEAMQEAIDAVEDQIFEKIDNPLLGCRVKNNILIKNINSTKCQELQ